MNGTKTCLVNESLLTPFGRQQQYNSFGCVKVMTQAIYAIFHRVSKFLLRLYGIVTGNAIAASLQNYYYRYW